MSKTASEVFGLPLYVRAAFLAIVAVGPVLWDGAAGRGLRVQGSVRDRGEARTRAPVRGEVLG